MTFSALLQWYFVFRKLRVHFQYSMQRREMYELRHALRYKDHSYVPKLLEFEPKLLEGER